MFNDSDGHDYYAKQMQVVKKWALNLAAIYLALFILVDMYRYTGESLQQAMFARSVFMLLPMVLILIVFYNQNRFKVTNQQFEWLSMAVIIAVGVGHTRIIEIGANNALFFPRIGLTIILIYAGLLMAMTVKKSILGCTTIIIIATMTYFSTGMKATEVASLVFFYAIFSSCCIFMNHVFTKILNANYSLIKVIDHQANSDSLTKLSNRRYFYAQSDGVLKQAIREKRPLALLLVDLDHFKTINDEMGHKYGDEVLINVGQILQRYSRRPLDITARLGGDEFVMLLDNAELNHVEAVCQGIITDISQITEQVKKICPNVQFGCSIGVGFKPEEFNAEISDLMALADRALYQVKGHGKNNHAIKTPADQLFTGTSGKDKLIMV